MVAINSINGFVVSLVVLYSLQVAIRAEINQGVLTSIYALYPVFMAISGKFIFHESIKWQHYIGILFMLCCGFLLAVSDLIGNGKDEKL